MTSRLMNIRKSAAMTGAIALSLGLSVAQLAANEIAAPLKYEQNSHIFRPVHALHGMAVSEQRLASEIGAEILRRGGNAVDAAVAMGFALAVVLPSAGNLGGGGFMLIHDAQSGRDIALDFREVAPTKATRDMFLDARGEVDTEAVRHSHLSVGVPGTVAGLVIAQRKYGTLPLPQLIAPAIALARRGFVVDEQLAAQLQAQAEVLGKWPSTRAIFFREGRPLRAGERLMQKDLAHSLELIARHGAAAFYQGEIAHKIVAEMARHDGGITLDDLARYASIERTPISASYRGYRIVSMPPPSSGGVHIIELLNMLERYPLKDYGADSAQTIHLLAEAMKLAFADRAAYLGDPDFVKVPVTGLVSRAYADAQANRIDPDHATPSARIGPGMPTAYESDQTTHYSVADRRGNVVSTTYTLNLVFGSGIVAQGTGILLNNEMDDFSAKPGAPNAFKLTGGEANAIAPGKRPLSSMSPTIVFKGERPWLVTGAAGGSRIISATLQTIINMIDFDMNAAEAAAQPRVHHQWLPDQLSVERGISADTLALLRQKGHEIAVGPIQGRTQTIEIDDTGFYGAADPRNPQAAAVGY